MGGVVLPLADLVLPVECAGCHRPGDAWCRRCRAALARLAFDPGGAAHRVVPRRPPASLPPVYAWGAYAGPLRVALPAWKDAGRRDLAPVLAPLLARAVVAAMTAQGWVDGPVLVVPVPSSRAAVRARGDTPVADLADRAVGLLDGALGLADTPRPIGPRPVPRAAAALVHHRRVLDQSGLDRSARRSNLAGALRVKPMWHNVIRGRRCVVVDDVVTTGATLAEASRALLGAGADGVVAATVAATPGPQGRPTGRRL